MSDGQESRLDKRDRLVRNGHVRQVATGRHTDIYEVDGDTDTYTITVDRHGTVDCHCTWSHYQDNPCSHELAVARKREEGL